MNQYVLGQPEIKSMLERSVSNNRLSHAYIFQGLDGVGRSEMALYLAALLYSDGNVDISNPSVRQIYAHEHPNVIEIRPKKNEIVMDSINDMLREFSKTSLVPGPRIYIIYEADKLNTKSANMLLKFVEEPQPGIHGIFITSHLSNMLSTIISRCNIVSFKALDKNILKNQLIENGLSILDAEITSELTNNVESAIAVSESAEYAIALDGALNFIKIKHESKMLEHLKDSYEIYKSGNDLKYMLNILHLILEDMLKSDHFRLSALKKDIKDFKERNDLNEIENKLSKCLEAIKMCDANVIARNVIYNLVSEWYR